VGSPLRYYRSAGTAARAHAAVRWASCPFPEAEKAVPRSGRILELGCGHGLFSVWLATESHERQVLGTDIDAGKIDAAIAAAASATAEGADLRFELAQVGEIAAGPWDAIAVIDVFYLLDADTQRTVVARLAAELAPGGVLVLKEMDVMPRWKHEWNRLQEILAVRLLHITAGTEMTFLPASQLAGFATDAGLELVESRRIDRHSVHPHHLIVARRPS
jgi:2-polyprenyl-3-methyl-5-hydroxy-6-metoxy-1,4-benzoquinol methylase